MDEGRIPHLIVAGTTKTLLLTETPPGSANVGEIILRDLVRHVGVSRVHCVAIAGPKYRWVPDPSLAGLAVDRLESTRTHGRHGQGSKWSAPSAHLRFRLGFGREVRRLVAAVLERTRTAGVDQVFAVLNNALMLAVGHRVAKALGVPLVTLVWDPPEYFLQQARFDRWSRAVLLQDFRASLVASRRVAVVSETMQQDYAAWTQAPIQILRHGLPTDAGLATATLGEPPRDEWVVGFAGSMYSNDAWRAFLKALDSVGWQVAGRPLRLKVLSGRIDLASHARARIDYLGFRPPEEVQRILSDCHLFYMPQPFVPHLRELCRYSFPTKLTNYLALGRPVLAHAPAESSLSAFLARHLVGELASSLESTPILAALDRLLGDESAYAEACRQATTTARAEFSAGVFHAATEQLLDADVPREMPSAAACEEKSESPAGVLIEAHDHEEHPR
ncbi:MAG: glycosyltransferase [Xanthomonadales bacterium]|nr:glycosyltransferase [Xanthomonadales bacterium]